MNRRMTTDTDLIRKNNQEGLQVGDFKVGDIRVGMVLDGFCGGAFARDSYADKRVEAVGGDWLVARNSATCCAEFYEGELEFLLPYIKEGAENG